MNDGNANMLYPTLDASISRTYGNLSSGRSAASKTALRDSYIRAIRWASDRLDRSAHGGIIAFVTNGGYIDSSAADGLRKSLLLEFDAVHVYNLRGNQRTSGEASRREGGKIFGSGSRSTVAVMFLVRSPDGARKPGRLYYRDIGDYKSREEKLAAVATASLQDGDWMQLEADDSGDWINKRTTGFAALLPLGDKRDGGAAIFATYSGGLGTSRDAWVYGSSKCALERNVHRTVGHYNAQVSAYKMQSALTVDELIDLDPTKISWSGTLKNYLGKHQYADFEVGRITTALYRPYFKQHLYFDRMFNHARGLMPKIFPASSVSNVGILVTGIGAAMDFTALATDAMPDMAQFGGQSNTQYFSRYTYERRAAADQTLFPSDAGLGDYLRRDNITDTARSMFAERHGSAVTKDDIFAYVYGLLHSPDYRGRFVADLKKTLPRIPVDVPHEDFRAFVVAGQQLLGLHTGYERVPMSLDVREQWTQPGRVGRLRVDKMAYGRTGRDMDKTTIRVNSNLTLSDIPIEAHSYRLGSRSAIDWLVERYQVKIDKASGIVNDPNDWADEVGDPRYIVDLLKRVVTVSVETMRIVRGLPDLQV